MVHLKALVGYWIILFLDGEKIVVADDGNWQESLDDWGYLKLRCIANKNYHKFNLQKITSYTYVQNRKLPEGLEIVNYTQSR